MNTPGLFERTNDLLKFETCLVPDFRGRLRTHMHSECTTDSSIINPFCLVLSRTWQVK